VAGLSAIGCRVKTGAQSGDKALDQLAGMKPSDEVCTGVLDKSQGIVNLLDAYHDKIEIQSKSEANGEKLKSVIVDVLATGVPSPLLSTFLSNHGRIIVSPKASTWCTETGNRDQKPNLSEAEIAFAKANGEKVLGCWSKGIAEFSTAYNIVLHYDETEHEQDADPVKTEKIIRQNLIRVFGYVTGQLLSQIDFNKNESILVDGSADLNIQAFKTSLADNFVEDVRASMQANTSVGGSQSGRALWAEILKSNESDPVAAWRAIKADSSKASLKSAFEDFVFADAFDSRLCNQNTRKKLEEGELFARTGAVYRPVAEMFESMQKKLEENNGDAEKILAEAELTGAGLVGGMQLRGFFRAVFGGLFRAAGALFRGVVRVAGAVVRVVGNTIIRAAQIVANAAAFVVRFVANVGWVIARAAVSGVVAIHNWIWGREYYRGYYFRPENAGKIGVPGGTLKKSTESAMVTSAVQIVAVPRSQDGSQDWDNDGVVNSLDQCANTGRLDEAYVRMSERPSDERIAELTKTNADKYLITAGVYAGCARGQNVDYYHFRQTADYTGNYYKIEEDLDADGVHDSLDRCSNTPKHAAVWKVGTTDEIGRNYVGCSSGQAVDR
jgi:hypothetical protein